MKFLFDSQGHHIANEVNGQLYAPNGPNIGHKLAEDSVFIDMKGKYLGEIVQTDRLLYNSQSPYRTMNYGCMGNFGSIGSFGSPGAIGAISLPSGFSDVDRTW